MNPLAELFENSKQSPWIDNLSRSWLNSGRIVELQAMGIRGLTSNPTIFANAISKSDDYDKEYFTLINQMDTKDAYWKMACTDVAAAADILIETYRSSDGTDGFVSIEVDPNLAHDTQGTIDSAQTLWDTIHRPNLMIKIPATLEGIPAITEVLSRGISVNVTLIFGISRYKKVMEAHIQGVKRAKDAGLDLSNISSVASFFVSRVDTKVDPLLKALGEPASMQMGKTAVALAQSAYLTHVERYQQNDWAELSQAGAKSQRPLWASTSTKNPDYSDLLYVESLIAPNTVNTMPEATALAFADHGNPSSQFDSFESNSKLVLETVQQAGINMDEISDELEKEGVHSFSSSFSELLDALDKKLTKPSDQR